MQKIITAERTLFERTEEFFGTHFPNLGWSEEYTEKIKDRKRPLAELLGLPGVDSGRFVQQLTEPPDYVVQTLHDVTVTALGGDREFSLHPKELSITYQKQKVRLSKIIKKASPEAQVYAYERLIGMLGLHNAPTHKSPPDWSIWWPKVGDFMKSFMTELFISPDPVLLLASGLGKDSFSCHSPNSRYPEYRQGPWAYASCPQTLGVYVRSQSITDHRLLDPHSPNNPTLGRCLYWVSNTDMPFFVQGRPYFHKMTAEHQRLARDIIEGMLRDRAGLPPERWANMEGRVAAPDYVYMDTGYLKAYYLPSVQARCVFPEVAKAICPVCLRYMEGQNCCYCVGIYCAGCEKLVDEDCACTDPSGDTYCEDCFSDRYFLCNSCEEYTPVDEYYSIRLRAYHEVSWCEHCAQRYATRCDECGEVYVDSYHTMTTVNNHYNWCESCLEYAYYCEICEEHYSEPCNCEEETV